MPYVCICKTASEDDIDVPVVAETQLTSHISPRTPCTRVPYAALIRPREKAPRNSDLRHECQRELAGRGIVHTQKGAKNQTN